MDVCLSRYVYPQELQRFSLYELRVKLHRCRSRIITSQQKQQQQKSFLRQREPIVFEVVIGKKNPEIRSI